MGTMLFRLGYVFVMFFAQHTAQKVTSRCNDVKFRTVMCLNGTVVQIKEISVNISSDSGPERCRGNKTCSFKLPVNHTYYESIRKACDGHISCDGIKAEPINFTCDGDSVTSHFTFIRFSCVESTETKMAVTCDRGTGLSDSLLCQPGYGIQLKNVYTGVARSNSCQPIRGDCVEREDELILQNYREQCNGRLACEGYSERENETSTSCRVGNGQTFKILEYSCVQYPTHSSLKCFGSKFGDVRCNQQEVLEIVNIFVGVTAEETCASGDLNQTSGCLTTLISVSPMRHNYISDTCVKDGCQNITATYHTHVSCNGADSTTNYTLIFYRCHKATVLVGNTTHDPTDAEKTSTALWGDTSQDPNDAVTIHHDPVTHPITHITPTDDTNVGHNVSFVGGQGHPIYIMYIAIFVPVAVVVAVSVVVLVVCLVKRRNPKANADANDEHPRYPDQSGEQHNVYSLAQEIPLQHNEGFKNDHTGTSVNTPDVNPYEPHSIAREGVNTSPKTDIYVPLQKANTGSVPENNKKHRDNIEGPCANTASPVGDMADSHREYTTDQDSTEVRHLQNLSDQERSAAQLNDQNANDNIDTDTVLVDNKMYGSLDY